MPRLQDDLVWFPELEAALELQGAWEVRVHLPPPFTVLCAECLDSPLSLEVYALDPDYYRGARQVARDLIQVRLLNLSLEEIQGNDERAQVRALGFETDLPTEIVAQVTYANDAFYVMAFSAWPGLLEPQQWRVQAMFAGASFGQHRSYGRGIGGLARLVSAHLTESDVVLGRTRGQLGFLRDQATIRRGRPFQEAPPEGPPEEASAPLHDDLLNEPTPAPRRPPLSAELREFERRLQEAPPTPQAPPTPTWPPPWAPLPNVQPEARLAPEVMLPHRLHRAASRELRELELFAFIERLPAQVALCAEKAFGVPATLAWRADEPFPVMGLDHVPLLLEALLRLRQGVLTLGEPLLVGSPRRALGPLGRRTPEGGTVSIAEALRAMLAEDDGTGMDLIGWHLGWRQVQARLASFGLARHSLLSPSRARLLAMTALEGPLAGLSPEARVELWRSLSEEERRELLGALHKQHLETPFVEVEAAALEFAQDPAVSWAEKARWALALGPRGCAREYGGLFAALLRGEVLGAPHAEEALKLMRPCVGDQLSGGIPGVELRVGKLGQRVGALAGAGVLSRVQGGEVAICVLVKEIQTQDYGELAELLRVLAALVYEHVMDL